MDSIPHIHLDEISPETAKMLARGCKQLYLNIIAICRGQASPSTNRLRASR